MYVLLVCATVQVFQKVNLVIDQGSLKFPSKNVCLSETMCHAHRGQLNTILVDMKPILLSFDI